MKLHMQFTGFEQRLFLNQTPFFAKIYDGIDPPAGFNVVTIALDATERSLLNWAEGIAAAHRAIEKGMLILWELQFALLDGSMEDEARFLTLQLNVQHFHEFLWPRFREYTFGVALFRGPPHEEMIPYLKSLAALLDEEITPFIFIDTSNLTSYAEYFRKMNQEKCGHLTLILKGPLPAQFPWALPALGWDHSQSPLGFCAQTVMPQPHQREIRHALCLPAKEGVDLEKVVNVFGSLPFRVIPENLLNCEWEGIEKLVIFPDDITERTARQIRGFVAAGGEVISALQGFQMA